MSDHIVLVEPVCRGSRLHWLWLVTKALQGKFHITIVVREDYMTNHFLELMDGLSFETLVVSGDFGGQWLPRISPAQWWKYVRKLLEFDRTRSSPYQMFFMALDDYLLSFFLFGWSRRLFRNVQKVWTVKYRVECLTASVKNTKQWVIGKVMQLVCRVWYIQLVVLDERILNLTVGGQCVNWLPDPWFGDFTSEFRAEAREGTDFATDDFVALVIGRQDERKGFPFLLNALPEALEQIPELKIRVCGKIDDALSAAFHALIDYFGSDRIVHEANFISEENLPVTYASASCVLMPYAPFFTSTSGVLPRAAASGVPVVASGHGLVGDRVRRYPLGETFAYGDVSGFVKALVEVRKAAGGAKYKQGCEEFSQSCSEVAFTKAVQDLFV